MFENGLLQRRDLGILLVKEEKHCYGGHSKAYFCCLQYDGLGEPLSHSPSEACQTKRLKNLPKVWMPWVAENGMDWMYANLFYYCTAGEPWMVEAVQGCHQKKTVFEELYNSVKPVRNCPRP